MTKGRVQRIGSATALLFTLFLMFTCAPSCVASPPDPDYLDPDLRARVEQLKADVADGATTVENAKRRAQVLWEWANAWAMNGGTLEVNLTARVYNLLTVDLDRPVRLSDLVEFDRYVRLLTICEEQPDAFGTTTTDAQKPFEAGSYQTIRITYIVGEMPIEPGGGIMVAQHFLSNQGVLQHDQPGDNYISIQSSNPKAHFEKTSYPLRGLPYGGFRSIKGHPLFKLSGAKLVKGDTVTLTYGDHAKRRGKGFKVQTHSNDAFPLPVYIDFEGKEHFIPLPLQTYRVEGGAASGVHGFAPSIVRAGTPFDVSVRTEDRFYNRAKGSIPGYTVSLNGRYYGKIPSAGKAISLLEGVTLKEPGVYRFRFESEDGGIKGSSNPILVDPDPDYYVYWGETHGHCGFAEGQGTIDGFFTFGRDDARLDFLTLSEHDKWLDDWEWQALLDAASRFNEEGKFIVFPGYEWSSSRLRGGHHNVLFRSAEGRKRVPIQEAPLLSELYHKLRMQNGVEDVLIIPHAHQAADWRMNDPGMERLVEIKSMHGTFEWFGKRYLDQGHQVGFVAASDDHLSHPGYAPGVMFGLRHFGGLAAVAAPSKTRDGIFDALRERRTYATSGSRIILDATLNGEAMGTRQPYTQERELTGSVHGTAAIDTVTLVKNGKDARTYRYAATSLKPHVWVSVNFYSQSHAFGRDNPRGFRPWEGVLEVEGATLVTAIQPGLRNQHLNAISVDPGNKNRLTFSTTTRGNAGSLHLELENASMDTLIRIHIEASVEKDKAPVIVMEPNEIPAVDEVFQFSGMVAGTIFREYQVGRYRDRLSLELIDPGSPMDQSFTFTDDTIPGHGDYYYVRVRQIDGGMAWSSPFWVGGEARR